MFGLRLTPNVKALLIINIIMFIGTQLSTNVNLTTLLAVYYPASPRFHWWQPVTYMFMHGNFTHILFNMFALVSFGAILEDRWGGRKFLIFYFVTGIGALLMQWGVQAFQLYQLTGSITLPPPMLNLLGQGMYNPQTMDEGTAMQLASIYSTPMVGASGAIFGLLVAFGMLFPDVRLYILFIPVPVKAKYIIPVYILLELFLGIAQYSGDSVAHFAHLGGGLIGFILVKLWKDNNRWYNYHE